MSIPDYQTLMAPVPHQLADGGEHAARDLAAVLAKPFALSDDELAQVLPGGASRRDRSPRSTASSPRGVDGAARKAGGALVSHWSDGSVAEPSTERNLECRCRSSSAHGAAKEAP